MVGHKRALLTGGLVAPQPAQFASLVFLEGFVKPLVMGTATGLAVAEFSGLGKGYDGFTPRYFGGVALAVGANVLYSTGVYLLRYVGSQNIALPLQVLSILLRHVGEVVTKEEVFERAWAGRVTVKVSVA